MKEYLQDNLSNEQHFYHNAIRTFVAKVSNVDEFKRKNKYLPNKYKLNQIKAKWKSRIDIMRGLIDSCRLLEDRNRIVFLKDSNVIKDLNGPPLIKNSFLLFAEETEKELSKLKELWANDFNKLFEFF